MFSIAVEHCAPLTRRARQHQLQAGFRGECRARVAERQHAFVIRAREGCHFVHQQSEIMAKAMTG
jgi:hypothetical protein